MNAVSPLVSSNWLYENLHYPSLIVIDGSLQNPVKSKIIPSALAFDWDKFSDLTNPLPHMMPTAEKFEQATQELGINEESMIVVYDRKGIYSSARVWWMFIAMGFKNCFVLDGGLPDWLSMGYPCVLEYAEPKSKGNFEARYKEGSFSNQEDVLKALRNKRKCIIDARSADRFRGKTAEPRVGLRLGHIPSSINIPFEELLVNTKMREQHELEKIFEVVGDKNTALIFSCGSGVTACVDALAATLIGFEDISIYDGSWSEWGQEKNPA